MPALAMRALRLSCTEPQLSAAVADVGEHVTEVRQHPARAPSAPAGRRTAWPAVLTRGSSGEAWAAGCVARACYSFGIGYGTTSFLKLPLLFASLISDVFIANFSVAKATASALTSSAMSLLLA